MTFFLEQQIYLGLKLRSEKIFWQLSKSTEINPGFFQLYQNMVQLKKQAKKNPSNENLVWSLVLPTANDQLASLESLDAYSQLLSSEIKISNLFSTIQASSDWLTTKPLIINRLNNPAGYLLELVDLSAENIINLKKDLITTASYYFPQIQTSQLPDGTTFLEYQSNSEDYSWQTIPDSEIEILQPNEIIELASLTQNDSIYLTNNQILLSRDNLLAVSGHHDTGQPRLFINFESIDPGLPWSYSYSQQTDESDYQGVLY